MSAQRFSYLLSILLIFSFLNSANYAIAATQKKSTKNSSYTPRAEKLEKATKIPKNAKNTKATSKKSVQVANNKKEQKKQQNSKNKVNNNKNITIRNNNIKNNKKLVATEKTYKNTHSTKFEQYTADGKLNFRSDSVLVIDQRNGKVLLEKNSYKVVPIASVSKLMTAMVVLDAKLPMNGVVTIDENDIDHRKNTTSRLPMGTKMTRETAMLLALMSSENRAANALGRHYPGGMSEFVKAMNKKARSLGMWKTNFVEPTGLSNRNVSTAQDLAKMVAAASKYPIIRQFTTTAEATLDLNGELKEYRNSNSLVRGGDWEIGVSKTGYISEAGRCVVMQASLAQKPTIIVLLDSHTTAMRTADANSIKDWLENSQLVSYAENMQRKENENRHRSMTTNAGGYYVY